MNLTIDTQNQTPDVMTQVYTAMRHPAPLITGALLGALVPVGTYTIGHGEMTDPISVQGAMVLGGLGFSAVSVYCWGRQAFNSKFKAACFVLLIELMMSFAQTSWLSQVALGFLIAINAISNGSNLVQQYLARHPELTQVAAVAPASQTSLALSDPPIAALTALAPLPRVMTVPATQVVAAPAAPAIVKLTRRAATGPRAKAYVVRLGVDSNSNSAIN